MSWQHWFLGGCVYCGILLIYLAGVNLVAWGSFQYKDHHFRHGCFSSQGEMVVRLLSCGGNSDAGVTVSLYWNDALGVVVAYIWSLILKTMLTKRPRLVVPAGQNPLRFYNVRPTTWVTSLLSGIFDDSAHCLIIIFCALISIYIQQSDASSE